MAIIPIDDLQQGIALLEDSVVVLKGIEISRHALGHQHINKAAAQLGRPLDDVQIFRREHHAGHVTHQLAQAGDSLSAYIDQLFLLLIAIQPHPYLVRPAVSLHGRMHGCCIRAYLDHILIVGGAVASPQAAKMNGFEQVGFAGPVFAHKNRQPIRRQKRHLAVAAEMMQTKLSEPHYL